MGLSPLSCGSDENVSTKTHKNNPDPLRYSITKHIKIGKFLVVMINYPNCTNYEGNKICLYKNVTIQQLKSQKYLDPHFSKNKKYYSPIARFEPTDFGWDLAITLANEA
jgi:hypothetical protein